jgi:hypothetical protein
VPTAANKSELEAVGIVIYVSILLKLNYFSPTFTLYLS